MAEALGVVASGIAVTQLATQVTSSIIKLKSYWEHIKDVPSEISFLLREIDALNAILCHIQDDRGTVSDPALLGNSVYLEQSLQLCEQGSTELKLLVNELAAKIEGGRGLRKKIGSAKVALRNEEIKTLKRRMKSAIRLLSLSYQCHSSAMIRFHSEFVVTRLSNQITSIANLNSTHDVSMNESTAIEHISKSTELSKGSYHDLTYASSWFDSLFGRFEYRKRRRKYKGKEEELYARFKLPVWFSQMAWDAYARSTISGWKFALRTYRMVHSQSPLFVAVKRNDTNTVRQLLKNGEAFVTDWAKAILLSFPPRPEDVTALHLAAAAGDLEMCQLLLSHGADPLALNNRNKTPLHCLTSCASRVTFRGGEYGKVDVMGTFRLLLKSGASDVLIDDPEVLEQTNAPASLFRLIQEEMYPPFSTLPLQTRLNILVERIYTRWHNVPFLLQLYLVRRSGIEPEVLHWTNSEGDSFLHLFANEFGDSAFRDLSKEALDETLDMEVARQLRASNSNASLWDELIRKFISAGAPLHTIDQLGLTPFWGLFWTHAQKYDGNGHIIVRMWLEDLLSCGVDLQTYGREEYSIMKINGLECMPENFQSRYGPIKRIWQYEPLRRIISFSYGPLPENWKFYFSEPTDDYAEEFWAMIEAEPDPNHELIDLAIPGSWNEDD